MKRSLIAVAVAAAALTVTAPAGAAVSSTPPAGMTSTCTGVRSGTTITESGVLHYADGTAAAGYNVDVLWQQGPSHMDWATAEGHWAVSGTDGSWSQTYTVPSNAEGAATTVYVMWKQGSKARIMQVGACIIG